MYLQIIVTLRYALMPVGIEIMHLKVLSTFLLVKHHMCWFFLMLGAQFFYSVHDANSEEPGGGMGVKS